MPTVTPSDQPPESAEPPTSRRRWRQDRDPEPLPVRWVVIGLLTAAAATVGYLVAGPVAAITAGCTVATAAHKLIA
jgi:hypothetical protein